MFELSSIYTPITAVPNIDSDYYTEIKPCKALQPYIRCFWGSRTPVRNFENSSRPVIPDTCMDIIFHTNYSNNIYDGKFCALDEGTYISPYICNDDITSTFAIRFYAWSAVLFCDNSMKNSKNLTFDIDDFFKGLKKELEPFLTGVIPLSAKIKAAENVLMKRININKLNNDLMNSFYYIITNCGNVSISDICSYTVVSKRSLERIFENNIGVSPKTMQSLVRYQLLWQDIFFYKSFDIFNSVLKYGYFDQAHLLNDFRRRHSVTPNEALKIALF